MYMFKYMRCCLSCFRRPCVVARTEGPAPLAFTPSSNASCNVIQNFHTPHLTDWIFFAFVIHVLLSSTKVVHY